MASLSLKILLFIALTVVWGNAHAANLLAHQNGKIAFTSNRDGNLEIYVMNPDGANQLRLTNNPGVDDYPTWSPDGTKIAFVSQVPSGVFVIKVMDANGMAQTELTSIVYSESPYPWHDRSSLSWSPDGGKIAFQENNDILIVNIDGSNRTNITNSPSFYDVEPSWSPDGSRILFISSRLYWLRMHTIRPDGTDLQDLPSGEEYWDTAPSWSPAGDRIVFIVNSEMYIPIMYTANADGTNRLAFDGNGIGSEHRNKPSWSPDGTKIVFHIWEYFSNDADIFVKDINGGGSVRLTSAANNFHPSWQPLPSRVTVSGRVTTAEGASLRNATVSITDPAGTVKRVVTSSFGLYHFDNVATGPNYVITVASKRYRFTPQQLTVNGTLTGVDFAGQQ